MFDKIETFYESIENESFVVICYLVVKTGASMYYDLREVLLFDGIQYAEYSTIDRASLYAY